MDTVPLEPCNASVSATVNIPSYDTGTPGAWWGVGHVSLITWETEATLLPFIPPKAQRS